MFGLWPRACKVTLRSGSRLSLSLLLPGLRTSIPAPVSINILTTVTSSLRQATISGVRPRSLGVLILVGGSNWRACGSRSFLPDRSMLKAVLMLMVSTKSLSLMATGQERCCSL